MKRIIIFVLFILCFIANSFQIFGKCVKIYDGDTIVIQEEEGKGKVKIRFADIDAPEISQPSGEASKNYLSNFILNKKVYVIFHSIDMYGRIVGTVYMDRILGIYSESDNVNKKMVQNGYAWWFKNYSKNMIYAELEKKAREEKRGIWCFENNIQPWLYRKIKKKQK